MADAVGTQTETVVIRGMALGVSVRKVFARELLTGLVIGALLGSAFFVFSLAVWHEEDVAAAVAISLAISCSIASVVAMALPYGLRGSAATLPSAQDRWPPSSRTCSRSSRTSR